MKNINELRAIVGELEKKTKIMGFLASLPRPYNPADRWMIKDIDKSVERIVKLLTKEINEAATAAQEYRQKALRLRDVEMNSDAILCFVLLRQIEIMANEQLSKVNAYIDLCNNHN